MGGSPACSGVRFSLANPVTIACTGCDGPGDGHTASFAMNQPAGTPGTLATFAGWTLGGASPTGVVSWAAVGGTSLVTLTYASVVSGMTWSMPAGLTACLPGYITAAGSGVYTDS